MTCAQVQRGARDAAAVAVHPDGRERARRAREVMRAVAASRPVADHGGAGQPVGENPRPTCALA